MVAATVHRLPTRLQLLYGADAAKAPATKLVVIDGIVHRGSITLMYGKPKSGKSFLATDCGLAVADTMRELWMGHRVRQRGPVLYIACEGEGGFWKRLEAFGRVPDQFVLATGRPALLEADSNGRTFAPMANDVKAAANHVGITLGVHPVLLVIDTVFRSFGAGNVNDPAHMMAYVAAISELTQWDMAVLLVHHATKGTGTPAGSVALMGAADTLIEVEADESVRGLHSWAIEQSKDDAPTDPRRFKLEVVEGIRDAFGDEVTSCKVVDLGVNEPRKAGPKPKGEEQLALEYLREILTREGEHNCHGVPQAHAACPVTKWRDLFMSRTRPDDLPATKRKAWERARNKLQALDMVAFAEDYVWITHN